MTHLTGPDRAQTLHRRLVNGLDLAAAGFTQVKPKMTGRLGLCTEGLLKLYIYGYLNRVRSSRRLEAETHRNIEVIGLLRHLEPDFKNIADLYYVASTAKRSARSSANSCCCAGTWICLAANCSRSTAPGSRRHGWQILRSLQ
jgi:hypothetical protein